MNILVTIDKNYLQPLYVMLQSLFINDDSETMTIYLIYDHLEERDLRELRQFCTNHHATLFPIQAEAHLFAEAPVVKHYTQAMYYRLLAYKMLPKDVDKVLYLDPDILVINSFYEFYHTNLSTYLFAAASHTKITKLTDQVNKLRLNSYDTKGYFNSGVLLMNLKQQRQEINEQDIFTYVRKHKLELILPDQDILNSLYGKRVLSIDDTIYNYDTRSYQTYYLLSNGEKDIDWVMTHTIFLHFCGKNKPWNKSNHNRFSILYKHYQQIVKREKVLNKKLASKKMRVIIL
ncbi:glycosyltransferase family 8 protein [Vagococcus entomophilus]|nr:glycosyltransferase family 8 protein [Vagococcus entomophilus]